MEKKYIYKLLSGKLLTAGDFVKYFEKKVFKTINKFKLLEYDDKVVVALSGGKDSITLLYLLHKFMKKKNLEKNLSALLIDEGIKNYRNKTIIFAKKFCDDLNINLHIEKFETKFKSQDYNVNYVKKNGLNLSACNICGTYRRNLLNTGARKLKATKVATGHNLDDESQNILLNIFKNNFKILSRLGVMNGVVKDDLFVPRIKPLYFMSEKEVRLYTIVKNFDLNYTECPYSKDQFRNELSDILNELEDKHKGIKQSVVNFFLEIEPELKKKYIDDFGEEKTKCGECGELSQQKICNACKLKNLLY